MIKGLFLSTLIATCTYCVRRAPRIQIDPAIQPHVDRFYEEAARRGLYPQPARDLIIRFEPTLKSDDAFPVMGECRTYGIFLDRVIAINQEWWDNATELRRLYTVVHQLGHCILDKRHPDDPSKDPFMQTITSFRGEIDSQSHWDLLFNVKVFGESAD